MKDINCTQFLQWSLPRLHLRWPGFRKVRRQVCKRINRRQRELGLADISDYRSLLEDHPEEWPVLDALCRVSISRFYRDRNVFEFLEREVLVKLSEEAILRGEDELRCWSIGCASGEEPYTLAILWNRIINSKFPSLRISILATDVDRNMIERAEKGCFAAGRLKDLPPGLRDSAFDRRGELFCTKTEERKKVNFLVQDIREDAPEGEFHFILCRNLAFTYFDADLQHDVLRRMGEKLVYAGALVIGIHESLPAEHRSFTPWPGSRCVFRKIADR